MELRILRDTLSAAGSCCTVKSEIPIETEILISDYLPQVFKIVKCFAKLVVLQKQLQSGRLNLEGYLRCIVYYQGEDGQGLCQTEQKLPFSKAVELPAMEYSTYSAVVGGETEFLNCRAVNQRRIEVRGAYELSASVYTQLQQETVIDVMGGGAQQKRTALAGVRCVASVDKLINAEGEFRFHQPPAAVLDVTGAANLRELRLISGKAVLKGEIQAELAYRTGEERTLRSQQVAVPFHHILDVDGLTEECNCFATLEPVGFTLVEDPDGEERSSKLSVSAVLHLRAYREYEVQLVTDLFSTQTETETEYAAVSVERLASPLDETVPLSVAGQLPDENARLLACFPSFAAPECVLEEGRAQLRVRGVVTVFCENSLGEIESYEKPMELLLPLAETEDGEPPHLECWLSVRSVSCAVNGGSLEVSVAVQAEGVVLTRRTVQAVASAVAGEAYPSADPEVALRIYYAQSGEELFEIARRYHVSPEELCSANGLAEERLSAARKLLVPSGR